jgi:hypothetical protein
MLASLAELRSYYIRGRDGEIGRIADLCFREEEWIARYVVVTLEDLGREALLLAAYLSRLDPDTHTVWADIRREQVENTPPLDRAESLTRQREQELHELYGWPIYWWEQEQQVTPIGGLWDELQIESEDPDAPDQAGPQLLFAGDLIDVYHIQSEDGEVGILKDMIVEDESWIIPYIVVHLQPSGNWVLLASDDIQTIDLGARSIHVAVPRDVIANSPVLSSEEIVTPELQQSLREYYDRYSR